MKFYFFYLIILGLLPGCKNNQSNSDKITFEVYICPKAYLCNLYIDNGIFNYPLDKSSVFQSKERSCFLETSEEDKDDSVITMFYNKFSLDSNLYKRIFQNSILTRDSFFSTHKPRGIVIVSNKKNIDTISIFRERIWKYQGKAYDISNEMDSLLFTSLPVDLKNNWK
jgi:hypothetical protein